MKYFRVKLVKVVEIPYEEGLIEGLINNNHLMYIAHAKPELKYSNDIVEIDFIHEKVDGKKDLKIPLTIREKQDEVTLVDVANNKKTIYLND